MPVLRNSRGYTVVVLRRRAQERIPRPTPRSASVPGSGIEFPPPVKQVELVLSTSEEQNWKVSTARTLRPGEVDVGGIQSWAAALLHQTIVAPS